MLFSCPPSVRGRPAQAVIRWRTIILDAVPTVSYGPAIIGRIKRYPEAVASKGACGHQGECSRRRRLPRPPHLLRLFLSSSTTQRFHKLCLVQGTSVAATCHFTRRTDYHLYPNPPF